ncbi:MAG: phosphotransferase, partial [Desulfovibrionales bacterium]
FLVLSGQEVTTSDLGDVLVFGAGRSIQKGVSLAEIREKFPRTALVLAHPYRKKGSPSKEKLLHPLLDGVEIFSTNHSISESQHALEDWHKYKFTAIGGTDTHTLSSTGTYPTQFDHPIGTMEQLVEEIRKGRCRPYFQEIPKLGTTRTRIREVRIGPGSAEGKQDRLIVKQFTTEEEFEDAYRSFHILRALTEAGFGDGPYRVPKPLDENKEDLVLIEEAVHGTTLHRKMLESDRREANSCLRSAAVWLAKFHNLSLRITPTGEFLEREPRRLNWYLKDMFRIKHPHRHRARELLEAVLQIERNFYENRLEALIQGHGDFHPKNIFIGRDVPEDPQTEFVAAIDFNSSYRLPRAFDVGTFLAQYRNQFFSNPETLRKAPEKAFLNAYMEEAEELDKDFADQVELFKTRTSLSILYYLVKVGLGDSENFWKVLVDAEQSLNRVAVHEKARV